MYSSSDDRHRHERRDKKRLNMTQEETKTGQDTGKDSEYNIEQDKT